MGRRRSCSARRCNSRFSRTRLVPGPVEDVPLWGTSASCAAANRRRGGLPTRRRLPACPTLGHGTRSTLREGVLVLAVADDERALAGALRDHELEARVGRVGGDERDGAVIVLAWGDIPLRLAESAGGRGGTFADRTTARLGA